MNTGELRKAPEDEHIGQVMTNFDHTINAEIGEKLKLGGVADYPAWDFHGTVWFEDGEYHCQIMRFHNHVDTLSAATPKDLMQKCSDKWGHA